MCVSQSLLLGRLPPPPHPHCLAFFMSVSLNRSGSRCLFTLASSSAASFIKPSTLSPSRARRVQSRSSSTSTSTSSSTASFALPRFNLPTSSLRLKPSSPSYFTGRPIYTDLLLALDRLTAETKRSLEQNHFLPLNSNLNHLTSTSSSSNVSTSTPSSTLVSGSTSTSTKNLWKSSAEMSILLGTNLKAAHYRTLIKKLSTLYRYREMILSHLADRTVGVNPELAAEVMTLLNTYSRQKLLQGIQLEETTELAESDPESSEHQLQSGSATPEATSDLVDEQGRSYALGRRKESSCRVWIIPSKADSIGQVLINSQPISNYFTRTNHREAVLHPMKLSGLLGTFNIFTLVKGGGHSGQAGAIAHGIAKALVRWFQHQFVVEKNEIQRELLQSRWEELRGLLLKGESELFSWESRTHCLLLVLAQLDEGMRDS